MKNFKFFQALMGDISRAQEDVRLTNFLINN